MLLALGTAFAQEAVSNEQWQADYNAETKTLTVTVTATQINGADAAIGVEGLVGFIWKDAVGSGTNLPVEKSNNGFTMTAAVSNVEATDKVTLIARWEWAGGGIYQAPDYVYGESGGEEPEPEPAEPVTPTAESYVVTWEAPVYDASAQTLTLSGAIATAENAGFEWSQITGPMVNFTINQGSDVTVGAANVDGKYTATFSNVVAGTQLSYKANIITGANAVVAGSNVTVSDEGWVYTPEGEPEPEDPVTVSIVAQYLNGNAAFSSTMTVPVATANADGDVDVTCQFYYYSAADEYAQATPVGEVFSDNTEGSLVVEDVEIQASSAFPLPAGTYKFEAVWMYGEEELRTGLSAEVVVPEPEPAKGPDALYLRGDMGGLGWHDNETNPDNMADWALATTTDNIVYVWDWSDAPRKLEGNFKFGRLQTAEEVDAGQGWGGLADGAYGTDGISEVTEELGSYPIATPGGNFNMGGNSYLISKITLDLISMTVTFEYNEPDPEISIYLAGGSFGDGVLGVVEEETESATWTFEEPATVSGSFAIEISILAYGSEAADVYYVGPETAGSIVLNEGTAVVEVARTEEQGNMFVVPEGETWAVSSIVLQGGLENTNGTVTIMASVIPTAIDETEAAVVTAADGRIYAEGEFTIVNLAGQDITDANGSLQGTYIVITGDDAVKVYVD